MWNRIAKIAGSSRSKIAIGPIRDDSVIGKILGRASKFANMVVMGQSILGYDSKPSATVRDAVAALKGKQVNGLVMGGFDPEDVHAEIEAQFHIRLIRVGLVRLEERTFFIGPMTASGGESVRDRLEMIEKTVQILQQLDQDPKIGVLSYEQKYLGNDPFTDSVLTEAAYIVHHFAGKEVQIEDSSYLVNQAVQNNCNLIVTPNGVVSNWIGTALYLAGAEYMGGLGLFDGVYIHTSTSVFESTYLSAITFAAALANLRKTAIS